MKLFAKLSLVALTAVQILTVAQPAEAIPDSRHESVLAAARNVLKRVRTAQSSYCYLEEGGQVRGVNADQPVRIASTMKLLTTLWALDVYGPNHRFETKIYYQKSNGEMHIEGARDPYFHRARLYLMLSDLNKAGITTLNKLTFDSKFYLNNRLVNMDVKAMNAESAKFYWSEDHYRESVDGEEERAELENAFNSSQWWNGRKALYNRIRGEQGSNPLLGPSVTMKANEVRQLDNNPLRGKPDVVVYSVKSQPIKNYLKILNNWSINYLADETFMALGGLPAFKQWLQRKHGIAANDVYTGSGLPVDPYGASRRDTVMTCAQVVTLIARMDRQLEKDHGMDMADVVMVAGLDPGTYQGGGQALVVKTGTLTGQKNLAGSANTANGEIYFGIFLQGNGVNNGTMQPIITSMLSAFGGGRAVRRNRFAWDPLDRDMTMTQASGAVVRP